MAIHDPSSTGSSQQLELHNQVHNLIKQAATLSAMTWVVVATTTPKIDRLIKEADYDAAKALLQTLENRIQKELCLK